MSWFDYLKPISLADALAELEQEQLFNRPARQPSPATLEALQRAAAPPLPADDLAQIKARRRPGGAS